MKYVAEINVMPLKELLDPQGKAVLLGLKNLGVEAVSDARIGKRITLELEAADRAEAESKVESACQQLLSNPIMEGYEYTVSESE